MRALLAFALGLIAGVALGRKPPPARVAASEKPVLETPTPASDGASRLRHDIRGALSPALLAADRLAGSADAETARTGAIAVAGIERAIALLDAHRRAGQSSPKRS